MLVIEIPISEGWDEKNRKFVVTDSFRLEMEHSLASLSKWESFFEKPFLGDGEKTIEEMMWYIQAMTLTPNVPPEIFYKLSEKNYEEINKYINASMTATTFNEANEKPSNKVITAELIYHMMVTLNIWLECENWHLNRLMALIKVCNIKNSPPKKMSRSEMLAQRRALNNQRRARTGSAG